MRTRRVLQVLSLGLGALGVWLLAVRPWDPEGAHWFNGMGAAVTLVLAGGVLALVAQVFD